MAVRDDRSDVKQTTTGFRGPLMVQSLTSAKSKFLSLKACRRLVYGRIPCLFCYRGQKFNKQDYSILGLISRSG